MKKALLIVFALLIAASTCCFAQEPATQKAVEAKTLLGKIVSVTLAEPAKGITSGTISVVDEAGRLVNVVVDSSVKIVDASMSAITLEKIRKDEKVQVEYSKGESGLNEATSINVVK